MDSAGSNRPQRRTALVGRELGRYGIQIAALSETRLADVGEIKEVGAGYTFFWSGRKSEERREAGVGFAIKTELVGKLSGLPKGINDRLMTLRLPLSGNKHATIVSAYAPTMTNPDEVKDKFYNDLDDIISATPRTDKLILLGDFNARVGTDHQTWEGVIGPEGVGKCNSNGLLLLRKCAEHDLLITNTVFRLPNRNKTSWMHPRSKHWHLIDYVIVRRTDRQDVRVTKTMCGADCWTDHRLVVSKLNLRIQPARRPQGKKAAKRLDVSKLNQDSMRQAFLTDICNQLDAINLSSENPEENWTVFHKTVHSSAATTLGHPSRKHQDWFDENDDEIQKLLEEKHRLHKAHQDDTSSVSKKAAYSNVCKTVQTKLRDMQDSWLRKKTEEIQSFADRKDMKKFHDALKTIYGPKSSGATTLLSADGNTLLTDKEAILKRWAEHFNSVLNRPSSINEDAIDRLPQIECNVLLDEFPTVMETRKAVQQLSSGKAPGADAIPAEVYKAGGLPMAEKLTELFHCMWRKEAIPQEFKDASIIHLYKRKGNPQVCDNHRGISLLSIAGKILAKILLNRLNVHLDQKGLIPESQCGFRKDRGTIDMIFTARQLQEKCQEQNVDLCMTFVDLCLRKLLKIKWQDKIPDTEVLKKAGMQSMHTVLKLAQLRWTGHVIRMPDERLPKKVFYGELQEGKRSQGGQKKRYKDTLKASLKDFDIPIGSWEQTAQERSKWRGLINKGAALHEKKRICEAERKRRERKANTNGPPADSMTLTCSTCNRQFRARIGLVSHQRTHQHTRTYSRNNDGLSH